VSARPFVVLGHAAPEARSKARTRMAALAARLSELSGVDVGVTPLGSYDRVAQMVHHGEIDLAWLSPISLVSLARNRRVVPVLSFRRQRLVHYRCAILVSSTSRATALDQLRGRAAWVDRLSASGYVLPRIELGTHGVTPAAERFYGSHDGVVRAVASGRADFGATFAHVKAGTVSGPWLKTPGLARSIRVLDAFGEVPPDAIAARADLEPRVRDAVERGLRTMTRQARDRELLVEAFGAEELEKPRPATYQALRKTVFRAYERGLLESDATMDEAVLGVAATIEARAVAVPPDPPTMRKLPRASGSR